MNVSFFFLSFSSGSALCLFIPWIFLEKPKMDANGLWNFPPLVLILNCLCTFALNISVFLVISHTSALTIRVAGVVKDWVVVLFSALIFADTKLTVINVFGYGIGKPSFLPVYIIWLDYDSMLVVSIRYYSCHVLQTSLIH